MTGEAEAVLIESIRSGDAQSWSLLISRFERRLLSFVESRLRDRSLSEDIVQETFAGFLMSLPNYNSSTPLEAFLFSIAAHKLTDTLRRLGRRPTVALPDNSSGEGRASLPDSARRASSLLVSREGRRAEERLVSECLSAVIQRCITSGDYERLKCVELLFVLGWPNKDVAAHLGISEHAVANHKYFVVAKLKDASTRARLDDVSIPELLGQES